MNYKETYDNLIQKRRDDPLVKGGDVYCETHHITPRCMNGSDDASNLVNLTAREHYIAHVLLWMHYRNINKHIASPLLTAITFMQCKSSCINGRVFRFNSHLYEAIKIQVKIRNSNMRTVNNGITNKRIFKEDELPEGFVEGAICNFTGTIPITNGVEQRRINKDEVIPDGWHAGGSNDDSLLGKICITNGKINKYISKDEIVSEGFTIGTHSKTVEGYKTITNGNEVKYLKPNEKIPDGWYLGGHKGRVSITNGIENKYFRSIDEVPAVLPDNWRFGLTMKVESRAGRKPIKNVKLQLNKVLAADQFLTKQQIAEGWEYGRLLYASGQQKLQDRAIHMELDGKSLTIKQWSELTGIKPVTLKARFHRYYKKGIRDSAIILSTKGCQLSD